MYTCIFVLHFNIKTQRWLFNNFKYPIEEQHSEAISVPFNNFEDPFEEDMQAGVSVDKEQPD